MKPSKQEQQMNPGDMQKLRHEVIRKAVCVPAIDTPYIQVTFRKEKDGLWHTYSAYGADFDYKTGAEFMDCIGKAVDALNKKGGEQ